MQSSFRLSLSTLVFTIAVHLAASQTVSLTKPSNENIPQPIPQHFVCNTGYTPQQCHEQVSVLRPQLDKYGAARLGDWTWVLVKSDDWKELQRQHRMDPDSPAFTVLDRRETFFEEALVSPVTVRRAELVKQWSLGMDELLNLAVTHELGHALCSEKNERKADAYGAELRAGQAVVCK
jgi:hypothetical protein